MLEFIQLFTLAVLAGIVFGIACSAAIVIIEFTKEEVLDFSIYLGLITFGTIAMITAVKLFLLGFMI